MHQGGLGVGVMVAAGLVDVLRWLGGGVDGGEYCEMVTRCRPRESNSK